MTDLKEIKALLAGITPGPWWNERHGIKARPKSHPCHIATAVNLQQYPGTGEKNAAFIAAAPTLISELVERVEQLESKYAAQSAAFKSREGDWNRDQKNLAKEKQRIAELEKERAHRETAKQEALEKIAELERELEKHGEANP